MIKAEASGNISLMPLGDDFVREIGAAAASKVANDFTWYLKNRRFLDYFENQTGETKESIGVFRARGKKPAFVAKAGLGIRGSLNYLAGLYRGQAVSRSGKTFHFARKRDFIKGGWKDFEGQGRLKLAYNEILKRKIKEAEAKLEG